MATQLAGQLVFPGLGANVPLGFHLHYRECVGHGLGFWVGNLLTEESASALLHFLRHLALEFAFERVQLDYFPVGPWSIPDANLYWVMNPTVSAFFKKPAFRIRARGLKCGSLAYVEKVVSWVPGRHRELTWYGRISLNDCTPVISTGGALGIRRANLIMDEADLNAVVNVSHSCIQFYNPTDIEEINA